MLFFPHRLHHKLAFTLAFQLRTTHYPYDLANTLTWKPFTVMFPQSHTRARTQKKNQTQQTLCLFVFIALFTEALKIDGYRKQTPELGKWVFFFCFFRRSLSRQSRMKQSIYAEHSVFSGESGTKSSSDGLGVGACYRFRKTYWFPIDETFIHRKYDSELHPDLNFWSVRVTDDIQV